MKKKSILKKMESYSHTCTCDLCGADEEAHAEVHSHDMGTASPWDKLLIIRIVVAAVLFCLGMVLPVPETVELLLLIASTLVAGYDVFISAIVHVWRHHVLDECLLMSLASIAAFVNWRGPRGRGSDASVPNRGASAGVCCRPDTPRCVESGRSPTGGGLGAPRR